MRVCFNARPTLIAKLLVRVARLCDWVYANLLPRFSRRIGSATVVRTFIAAVQSSNRFSNGCADQINTPLEFCGVADQRTLCDWSILSRTYTRLATTVLECTYVGSRNTKPDHNPYIRYHIPIERCSIGLCRYL